MRERERENKMRNRGNENAHMGSVIYTYIEKKRKIVLNICLREGMSDDVAPERCKLLQAFPPMRRGGDRGGRKKNNPKP